VRALVSDGEVIVVKGKERNESGVLVETAKGGVCYKYTLSIGGVLFVFTSHASKAVSISQKIRQVVVSTI
jgi:hypothetical protein